MQKYYLNTARDITVTLGTSSNTVGWTLVAQFSRATDGTVELTRSLTRVSNTVFTGTLVAANSSSLESGAYCVRIVRTDSGSESVFLPIHNITVSE